MTLALQEGREVDDAVKSRGGIVAGGGGPPERVGDSDSAIHAAPPERVGDRESRDFSDSALAALGDPFVFEVVELVRKVRVFGLADEVFDDSEQTVFSVGGHVVKFGVHFRK